MKRFKEKKAITLVALVITIVVLIILATVAINLSLGSNGIFNRAKTAKEQYQNAQNYEETQIAKTANDIDSYVGGNREQIMVDKDVYDQLILDVAKLKTDLANIQNINKYTLFTGSTNALSTNSYTEPSYTITLPQEMKNTNYMISVDINRWGSGWATAQYRIQNVTTTSFQIVVYNNSAASSAYGFRWSVIGELKEE